MLILKIISRSKRPLDLSRQPDNNKFKEKMMHKNSFTGF